jgi:AraC family transcriptional regulator, regulatory protein of adaptative response / methylated-DNA-[protein]-cysteine methyltransferase
MIADERPLPDFEVMYEAALRRDPVFDGIFFVCVRSTKVFCRPTCSARNPRRENVEFVATSTEAARAGYRPCRRCRPIDPPDSHPGWVRDLIARAGSSESRVTDETLSALGLSPSRVRSYFRRRVGMTFHAFQRSLRIVE